MTYSLRDCLSFLFLLLNLINVRGRSVDVNDYNSESISAEDEDYIEAPVLNRKGGSCILDLNEDLSSKNQPLLLQRRNGAIDFVLPESEGTRGVIALRQGEEILVTCPGNRNNLVSTRQPVNRGACNAGTVLNVDGQNVKSRDLECSSRPIAFTSVTNRNCANGKGRVIELGFDLGSNGFVKLMEVCHNIAQSETYYARHTLHGAVLASKVRREHGTRPSFARGDRQLFQGFDPNNAYVQRNQEQVLDNLLGPNSDIKIDSKATLFLARGHLAPDADFLFSSHQFLTYFYVNVAPQWQSINAGNWLRVEETTRSTAIRLGEDMDVVTGTHGVLRLPTDKGIPREIRLWQDRVPVPELFWKVVRSPRTDSCIVFVATNNPFATGPPSKLICPDVCRANGWPVRQDQPRAGYIYCCEFAAFKQAVPDLPEISCKSTLRGR